MKTGLTGGVELMSLTEKSGPAQNLDPQTEQNDKEISEKPVISEEFSLCQWHAWW